MGTNMGGDNGETATCANYNTTLGQMDENIIELLHACDNNYFNFTWGLIYYTPSALPLTLLLCWWCRSHARARLTNITLTCLIHRQHNAQCFYRQTDDGNRLGGVGYAIWHLGFILFGRVVPFSCESDMPLKSNPPCPMSSYAWTYFVSILNPTCLVGSGHCS